MGLNKASRAAFGVLWKCSTGLFRSRDRPLTGSALNLCAWCRWAVSSVYLLRRSTTRSSPKRISNSPIVATAARSLPELSSAKVEYTPRTNALRDHSIQKPRNAATTMPRVSPSVGRQPLFSPLIPSLILCALLQCGFEVVQVLLQAGHKLLLEFGVKVDVSEDRSTIYGFSYRRRDAGTRAPRCRRREVNGIGP